MPDMTGRTLGKYRLIERLGRGGMADVYRAFQPSLERDVAIKVMHSYLAEDEAFIGRFRREAKAVADLHHPHIVQVFDFDVQDDVYYMVMEYIDGETLKKRLERLNAEGRPMPLEEVVRTFSALCDALDYAHEAGRIHRDLKPANIMFEDDRLVLTDFGLATIVGGSRYTLSGTVIGTPVYMSPEQGKGQSGDERSDIYSLGVVLYEMVTGRVPYDADTPLAIILKHVNEPLPMPRLLLPNLPPIVERVILKSMAKDPEDRYQSAGSLAEALQAAFEGRERPAEAPTPPVAPISAEVPIPMAVPVAATGPSTTAAVPEPAAVKEKRHRRGRERKLRRERRQRQGRRFWIHLGAVALLFAVAMVVSFVILPAINKPNPPPPPTPQRPLPPDVGPLNPQAILHYEAGTRALFQDWDLELAIHEFTQALEIEPGFAPAYHLRGVAHREAGHWREAQADFDQALALNPSMAEVYLDRAQLYLYGLDQAEQALSDLTQAINLAPDYVEAYNLRAQVYLWYLDDSAQALADLDTVIELAPDFGEAWCMRGSLYLNRDEYARALPDLRQGVERSPDDAYCINMLGFSLYWLEEYEEAVDYYSQAIALDTGDLEFYYNRAFAHLALGDLEEAQEDFTRVLRIEREHNGARYGLGRVYAAAGRYEEAIGEFSRVAEDMDRSYEWPYFWDDHPLIDRALAHQALDNLEAALADLSNLIDQDPYWYRPYYHRGMLHEEMGEIDAARFDFEQLWQLAPDEDWRDIAEDALDGLEE